MFNRVDEGRARVSEIIPLIKTSGFEFLYGEINNGIGYCALKYDIIEGCKTIAATIRTSHNSYIKISPKLIKGNQDRCIEHEIEHELILAFNWNKDRSIYQIQNKHILDCVSSITSTGHLVFRKSLLDFKVENLNDKVTKLL